MTQQHVASGALPTTKYGGLGGYSGHMIAPPTRIRGVVIGYPNEGKSVLLQTCPEAWIFNFDESSTVTPKPQATLFPGKNAEGQLLGDNNSVIVMDYDLVQPKLEILKQLARDKQPRPSLIAFDSLSSWIRLLRTWIPRNAKKLGLVSAQDARASFSWKEIDGRAAWDILYDMIVNTITDLSAHGYGVWLIGHVANEKIPIGENVFSYKPELTITPGFWKRLHDLFEYVGVVYTEMATEEYTIEEKVKIRDREIVESRRKTRSVKKRYLTTQKADLQGVMKQRVPLPDRIELSHTDAWTDFEKAYKEAIRKASTTP